MYFGVSRCSFMVLSIEPYICLFRLLLLIRLRMEVLRCRGINTSRGTLDFKLEHSKVVFDVVDLYLEVPIVFTFLVSSNS